MNTSTDGFNKDGFSSRLKRARESANLTLAQLAERSGISETYLWQLETGHSDSANMSVGIAGQLADALSISSTQLLGCEHSWCKGGGTIRDMRRPITEEWLIANGFRIEDGRNDGRLPIRSLAIGHDSIRGREPFRSFDDLCIDVAPTARDHKEWHVWLAQREPYRFVPIRTMMETWELVRLYEALTGLVWPGVL